LLPVDFLAVSPAEIYVSGRKILGRNALGQHEEYRLGAYQRWQPAANGTLAQRRASLQQAREPPASMMATAVHAGINHPTFVLTPGRRVVAVIGRAPEPAFVALDPKLQALQAWLANNYPLARVSISGLNETLTQGQVTVSGADLPPTTFFLGPGDELTRDEAANPRAPSSLFGQTHLERGWAAGAAVAVTLPPAGVALRGAVVTAVPASPKVLEDPLDTYHADVQAFAQQGIAVVRLLAPIPDAFASVADGSAWRMALDAQLQQVVDRASSGLLQGKPVCLYGEGLSGELALAGGGLSHVGCIAAVNAVLNAAQLSKLLLEGVPRGYAGLAFRLVGPTQQMLDRDFPAAFGNPQNQLSNSVSWVPGLPDNLMLGYDTARHADAARGYSSGDFTAGSGAFRSAARSAGKHVDFYEPEPRFYTLTQRQARMIDAVTRYVSDYYAALAAPRP
jgi:hypothetical protein